eukprot:4869228-Prymnesium_polylepis.1
MTFSANEAILAACPTQRKRLLMHVVLRTRPSVRPTHTATRANRSANTSAKSRCIIGRATQN